MHQKYIILSDGRHEYPVIFSNLLIHKEVAEGCRRGCGRRSEWLEVVGAGFFYLMPDDRATLGCSVEAFGESESLGIKSRPEDSKLLTSLICG